MQDLMTVKNASTWASVHIGRDVTPSNIAYLLQYGRITTVKTANKKERLVNRNELEKYYKNQQKPQEERWKNKLGKDLNWHLSFSEYKESQTTKHVHRLHAYKGKFIPQLVEYFLDTHTDGFKHQAFFNTGNAVLDPFCGSGTTLVAANELGLNAVGVDISEFNAFISNAKISDYDISAVFKTAGVISKDLKEFQQSKQNIEFEMALLAELKIFNQQFFPAPDFRYKVRQKTIDEKSYGEQKENEFLTVYQNLIKKYNIKLLQNDNKTFLDIWFIQVVRDEIEFVFKQIKRVKDPATKKILALILSRTMRSCRATTHADLGTLKAPTIATYYCKKHGKICKPLFSISNWWQRYVADTLKRIETFKHLKTNTLQYCLTGDSKDLDIDKALSKKGITPIKFDGIFSSPPYVGLIDYHQQHAYAYDLFGFNRRDKLEIGSLYNGQGKQARDSYTLGVAKVLNNGKKYLKQDYNIFLVANDKHNLYPNIAELAGMKIVNQYKRPVLNRVEKSRGAYAETIFHLKEK